MIYEWIASNTLKRIQNTVNNDKNFESQISTIF